MTFSETSFRTLRQRVQELGHIFIPSLYCFLLCHFFYFCYRLLFLHLCISIINIVLLFYDKCHFSPISKCSIYFTVRIIDIILTHLLKMYCISFYVFLLLQRTSLFSNFSATLILKSTMTSA